MEELARQLLVLEAGETQDPSALALAGERICGRLQRRMVSLIGRAGFAALFTRALFLARADHPDLDGLTFDEHAPTPLRGASEYATARDAAEVGAALVAILARFIGLLTTFIGEELSMRLLREIWPVPGADAETTPTERAER